MRKIGYLHGFVLVLGCQICFLPQQEKSILFSSLQLFFLNLNNYNFVYSRNKH
jgi:hypothetical protein